MPKPSRRASVPPMDPVAWTPTPARPLRAKLRRLAGDTRIEPHSHPWGQLAMSSTGTIRMTAAHSTFLVPPSRALWIPPDVEHVVTTVEDAEIRTLYVHPSAALWPECRVLEVSNLLRELVLHLDVEPGARPTTPREQHLSALLLDELRSAAPVRLGVDLPTDKRLRSLCEAVLEQPARWSTIGSLAHHAGASPRTVARLFRSELGTSFGRWRQQVLLAHALSLAARRLPMASIAAELGYASPSAFTAMVKRTLGAPPTHFFA
jgi:AraC-like DNA-binding protein/quercetin dioxygenase-like cupin family protein